MRYPQGDGLTAESQQVREELRLQAAERFARSAASSLIAKDLRVSVRSVQRWRQAWEEGGPRALRSQGPASSAEAEREAVRATGGGAGQGPGRAQLGERRTLGRIKTVIGRRFHLTYTIQGVRKLLMRNVWSCQAPARRAIERDDDAVVGWVKETWPCAEGSRRPVEHGSSSRAKPASP
ncbi:winged helix-turn-helix domain-containing protein [Streptomyces sparsogenes]